MAEAAASTSNKQAAFFKYIYPAGLAKYQATCFKCAPTLSPALDLNLQGKPGPTKQVKRCLKKDLGNTSLSGKQGRLLAKAGAG